MSQAVRVNQRNWTAEAVAYKVVETSVVTDAEIERLLNETVAAGWAFDSIHFSMWEGSKRPSMAFLMFVRPAEEV